MEVASEVVGVIGAFFILFAYFLLEAKKIKFKQFIYPFMNLFGALLVIFSLVYSWNLSAFIILGSWTLISLYGLYCFFNSKPKHEKDDTKEK
jgi:hypothetical protein